MGRITCWRATGSDLPAAAVFSSYFERIKSMSASTESPVAWYMISRWSSSAAWPAAPLYAAFPADIRAALENKLRHASEFFAKVVLTFVIRDMALLLDKYVKKCEKWLAE